MRRAPHDGQKLSRLQENATSFSCAVSSQDRKNTRLPICSTRFYCGVMLSAPQGNGDLLTPIGLGETGGFGSDPAAVKVETCRSARIF